jgi:adenosine kinase
LIRAMETATYLICNEYEFGWILEKMWLQQHDIVNMLEKIVITLGKNGVSLLDKQGEITIPWVKVDVVIDPTWAGDSFRSWLLAWLLGKLLFEDAAKIGNVVASFVVSSQGTLTHSFTKQDVKDKIKEVYNQHIDF